MAFRTDVRHYYLSNASQFGGIYKIYIQANHKTHKRRGIFITLYWQQISGNKTRSNQRKKQIYSLKLVIVRNSEFPIQRKWHLFANYSVLYHNNVIVCIIIIHLVIQKIKRIFAIPCCLFSWWCCCCYYCYCWFDIPQATFQDKMTRLWHKWKKSVESCCSCCCYFFSKNSIMQFEPGSDLSCYRKSKRAARITRIGYQKS